MIGRTISHYRVTEELGRGGMGVVYRAQDQTLRRDVALKVVRPDAVADPAARGRLIDEARTASSLNHPNVCTIFEAGEQDGQVYVVMELVAGKSLAAQLPPEGLPAETVVRYGAQIADALAHAHDCEVVHRDLKSANVMVTPQGRMKVLDFGLARRVQQSKPEEATRSVEAGEANAMTGTLAYMAPEQLRGTGADARSDIWALGVVLYEMAAGQRPFQGRTGFDLSSAILRGPLAPLPSHIPPGLRAVIQHCLMKEPGERYQRASEVRAALEAIATDTAERAAAPPAEASARSTLLRRTALLVGGVLFVLGALLVWKWPRAGSETEKVQSLAILPLRSVGAQANEGDLGTGIADTVITKVSQIRELTVRPSSAVRKYAAQETEALEAAHQLRVDAVLDGTLQRSGDRLRVNLNLLRTSDGASLWSETFNVSMADIFDMQDQIAQRVAVGLRLKLTPAEKALLSRRDTQSPEAYEFYVKGMQAFSRRGLAGTSAMRAVLEDAIAMFKRAIELDPKYALAHAQLAYSYVWMALFADPGPQWLAPAKEALRRAEALDPKLPELHIVRHELYWSVFEGFRIADAARELLAAQRINPSIAHEQLGVVYMHMGLEQAALARVRRALEIDPSGEINQARMVEAFDLLFRPDEAIAANQKFGNLPGPAFYLRKSYLWKNEFSRAEQENSRQLQRNPGDAFTLGNVALLDALQGRFAKAEAAIPELVRKAANSRGFHHVTYNVASIYALQGKAKLAAEWLQKTVDTGMPNYTLFTRDPHLDRIRKSPEFVAFMNELKPRWEAYQREFGGE